MQFKLNSVSMANDPQRAAPRTLGIRHICLFMLASALALQVSAEPEGRKLGNPMPGEGPIKLPAAGSGLRPQGNPMPGAERVGIFGSPIMGNPGQGAGTLVAAPTPPPAVTPMQTPATVPAAPVPPAAIPMPVSAPITSPVATPPPPPKPVVQTTSPANPVPGVGPVVPSAAVTLPPVQTPPRGTGPAEVTVPVPIASLPSATMPNRPKITPPGRGVNSPIVPEQAGGLATGAATSSGRLYEIMPDANVLQSSMRIMEPSKASIEGQAQQQLLSQPQARSQQESNCIAVTFRPDAQRDSTTLVDLTGDGLIVSAVPNAHIQAVFARAGYNEVSLAQPARWCITQAVTRELVQLQAGLANQQATRIVQVGQSWQLMTHDQWLSHQASLQPAVQDRVTLRTGAVATSTSATSRRAKAAQGQPNQQLGGVVALQQRLAKTAKPLVVAQSAKP
jgi:hypothetical protein